MYQKLTLKNGLRVILIPRKETKVVTLLVLCKVGSRYESQDINGISHFIEHMMFKGTYKRPTTLDISKELDGVGAEYNAFTGKDHTGYYIKLNAEKIDLAFDILSDMLFNSKFDEKEVNREKGVIVEEINMLEDNPIMYVEAFLEQLMYGEKEKLGQLISGSKKAVRGVKRQRIIDFWQKYYHSSNLVVAVAGRFDKKDIFKKVKTHFVQKGRRKSAAKIEKVSLKQNKPEIKINYKKTEQVQICLGFPGYSYFDKNIYALQLLAVILGGNMSSRLFISVRERQGLAYFIRSGLNIYEDTGSLVIQAGLDRKRLKEALSLIWYELEKVKKEGVSEKELKKAKDFLKGKLTIELEDSSNLASWTGLQELLTRKILTPQEKLKKINQVKENKVKKVAQEIIKKKKLNLVLIGPLAAKEKLFRYFV